MKIILAILMFLYIVITAVSSVSMIRKTKNKLFTEQERLSLYRQINIEAWVATAVLVTVSLLSGFSLDADIGLGFHFMQFEVNFVFAIIVILAACGFAIVVLNQTISTARSEELRISIWHKLSNGVSGDAVLSDPAANLLIPRTRREKNAFSFVAVTAGICEEITCRGVFFVVIQSLLPSISLVFVPLITGVLFGIGHSYQGLTGVLKTGLMGIGLGYLYLVTGSLLPGILLHFLIDNTQRFLFPKSYM
jgi:membrane protease YdiL (CAAX protease family)